VGDKLKCCGCDKVKDPSEFHNSKKDRLGKQAACIACNKLRSSSKGAEP
jgi:hypothetical protein